VKQDIETHWGPALDARFQQRHFYDEECDPEFEIVRPHGCGRIYEFLIEHKFRTGSDMLSLPLSGRSVLEVCCGSGMMSEKFSRAGARVAGIDFSLAAVARARERARRYQFDATYLVADAEKLAFDDRSFDVVAVHDGLHHLDNPVGAIREMARVAREAILIMEPAEAALTRLAIRLGIAVEVEDAGNEVRRLEPDQVAAILRENGFDRVQSRRTLMYYPHEPYRWFAWFDHPALFGLFRALFGGANLLLGRWGNKLALAAIRAAC
jgi:2-polyprenyl-3-methyl-5-hydroxy-6-metoxy-1,4-benzoquinol methylase